MVIHYKYHDNKFHNSQCISSYFKKDLTHNYSNPRNNLNRKYNINFLLQSYSEGKYQKFWYMYHYYHILMYILNLNHT